MTTAAALVEALDIGALTFPASFFLVAICEALQPARLATGSMTIRWFGNTVMFALGWICVAWLPWGVGIGAAAIAGGQGWGIFHAIPVPRAAAIALSIVILDFFGYVEHRMLHKFQPLWRLHALHHSDVDLDITTAIRHHPLEQVLATVLTAAFAFVLGAPPEAVTAYGTLVAAVQNIGHGNIGLPRALRWVRYLVVTPELHRLHHSTAIDESNTNFANLLPIWDRLFGTLRLEPDGDLRFGLREFAEAKYQRLDKMLLMPLLVTNAATDR